MKKIIFCFFVATLMLQAIAKADNSDDTLKFYLSKSDLVVLGNIISIPVAFMSESGVPNYNCKFKVADIIKGDNSLKGKIIEVCILRFEIHKKDHHPLIKKDAECILFLKKTSQGTVPAWVTSDFWFSVQYPSPWMVRSLKRLSKEKSAENKIHRDTSNMKHISGAILPTTNGHYVPYSPDGKITGGWTPTAEQIIKVQPSLLKYIEKSNKIIYNNINNYRCQFFGIIVNEKKRIYCNFFWITDFYKDWQTKPVIVDDGGNHYFQLEYDVKTGKCLNFSVNGVG